jgi:hypothetical protein
VNFSDGILGCHTGSGGHHHLETHYFRAILGSVSLQSAISRMYKSIGFGFDLENLGASKVQVLCLVVYSESCLVR